MHIVPVHLPPRLHLLIVHPPLHPNLVHIQHTHVLPRKYSPHYRQLNLYLELPLPWVHLLPVQWLAHMARRYLLLGPIF